MEHIEQRNASRKNRATWTMGALAGLTLGGLAFSMPATADEAILRFKGGIGVIPVSSVANCPTAAASCITGPPVTVNRNVVRGVQPAGQIWVIEDLDARVTANGGITVKGKGLILAGGDNAGRAPALSVVASLICQPTAPFTQSNSAGPGVMLPLNGDFQISGTLTPAPTLPCASPMLLILNAANLTWFAVGIPASDGDR